MRERFGSAKASAVESPEKHPLPTARRGHRRLGVLAKGSALRRLVSAAIGEDDGAAGLSLFGEFVAEPVESLVESLSLGGARALYVPVPSPEGVESELVGELGGGHGVGQVLLVGEHEQDGVPELVLLQHVGELLLRLGDSLPVVAVDDVYETLSVLEVVPPQGTDLVLAADVPHSEADVLVLDGLDVEADGRYRRDNLTELELVEDRSFAGRVEADHQDSHLLLAEQTRQQTADCQTHLRRCAYRVRRLLSAHTPRLCVGIYRRASGITGCVARRTSNR